MDTHILIIEDDVNLARFIELELNCEGYQVSIANDGLTGLTKVRETQPNLILLYWMLPGIEGVEICRRLRETGKRVPITFLTAKDDVRDRVLGLDAGANDYVLKPFSIKELLARIRVHLRPNSEDEQEKLQFEDLSLNRSTREVYRGERQEDMTSWATLTLLRFMCAISV